MSQKSNKRARRARRGAKEENLSRRGVIRAFFLCGTFASVYAGPEGMRVQQGQGNITGSGQHMRVNVSHQAVLEWQKFNLAPNESITFAQPSSSSIVWNKIADANPSTIFGRVEANGILVLQNPSGFYFGPNSFVAAAGLFVTTSPALPPNFAPGGMWMFDGPPPSANIINYGQLKTEIGGSLFLIAERVENHGRIEAPQGTIGLLAGQEVLISERPDGRGLSAVVKAPTGIVDNTGKIIADAGEVALHARVVNQGGMIQANTVRERNGVIELIASDAVNLSEESKLIARGSANALENGGQIIVKAGRALDDAAGSVLDIRGGGLGGNGGFAELSAPEMASIDSTIVGAAQAGFTGGNLYIDPTDILIGNTGSGTAGDGTVGPSDPPTTLRLNVSSAFLGLSKITLEATRDIDLLANTTWNLAESTGTSGPDSLLTLRAGRNITLRSGASLVGIENWSLQLIAGADFQNAGGPVSGIGNVALQGAASIQTGAGNIAILAGNNITVQSGGIRTVEGGDIFAHALGGSINTGTSREGYIWDFSGGYRVNAESIGGISTAKGGDVALTAGKDVTSLLLTGLGSHADAGSGAFGEEAGDVTITAGQDVTGHFVARNGTGKILAGRDAGTQTRQLALSLVKGLWDVSAANNIILQEVRNPNGVFNDTPFLSSNKRHQFDYDPAAAVKLKADSVQLLGSGLPRNPNENIPTIYPPSLSIEAGAGDILIGSDLYLFPSALANLQVKTMEGGDLRSGKPGSVFEIGMSDSTRTRWTSTADFRPFDPERGLIHGENTEPTRFDIDGNIQELSISVPKRVEMYVKGDLRNTSLISQHHRLNDITRVVVDGDIFNRNDWTFAFPELPPNMRALAIAVDVPGSLISVEILRNKFVYNPQTGRLGFQGRMSAGELNAVLNLRVRTFDAGGRAIRDEQGNFITEAGFLAPETVLRDIFERSQDVPDDAASGYQVGGPGKLQISADNIDLGITEGIVSHGPGANRLIAPNFKAGVDIDVMARGNLSMFSSSIQSRAGGDIQVYSDGVIDVGSQEILASSEVARGIYTAREGDVLVVARKDINVNGSRIAAYSGGDVTVRSLEGDVNAGEGGVGFVRVERVEVDRRGGLRINRRGIPGSGILATTFPDTEGNVGNITVETPQGDILAGRGGIAQLSFNGTENKSSKVLLQAGTEATATTPEYVGNIRASNSGVIGGNVELKATGNIEGIVVAQGNLDISSKRDVTVTALASGNVTINAVGNVAGTIVGVGSVDAQGGSISADVISNNANLSSSTPQQAEKVAANPAAQAAAEAAESAEEEVTEEDDKKKKGNATLTRLVGRVTVILPAQK